MVLLRLRNIFVPIMLFVIYTQTMVALNTNVRRFIKHRSTYSIRHPGMATPTALKSLYSSYAADIPNHGPFTYKQLPQETLYILDGTSMIYNAFYRFRARPNPLP